MLLCSSKRIPRHDCRLCGLTHQLRNGQTTLKNKPLRYFNDPYRLSFRRPPLPLRWKINLIFLDTYVILNVVYPRWSVVPAALCKTQDDNLNSAADLVAKVVVVIRLFRNHPNAILKWLLGAISSRELKAIGCNKPVYGLFKCLVSSTKEKKHTGI